MHSYNNAFYELRNVLQPLYDEGEAVAIAHEVLYYITGSNKIDRILEKDRLFTAEQQRKYDAATTDLRKGRPLQYVTGTAWFLNREYIVDESVLVPRPETEELVDWIIEDSNSKSHPDSYRDKLHILDIGTGSGCIPISLKLALQDASVTTIDISPDALSVALENAKRLKADIELLQTDFLDAAQHTKLGRYDVIVSNPPYIPDTEKDAIHSNVKDHEPAIALFVPGDDALLFYRAIALFGKEHLNANGYIYCELEAGHAMECKALFEEHGYDAEIRKDMHGNWRMLRAG